MERVEPNVSYMETLVMPFGSQRRQIFVPDGQEAMTPPSYQYLASHAFPFLKGFLIS